MKYFKGIACFFPAELFPWGIFNIPLLVNIRVRC